MTSPASQPENAVICRCSGTTAAQIRKQVNQGIVDLDGVSRATGACSGCGACDTDVMALLEEYRREGDRAASDSKGQGRE